MIKIEFPADRPDIARALGSALLNVANPATEGGDYEEAPKTSTPTQHKSAEVAESHTTATASESAGADSPKSESLFSDAFTPEQSGGTAEVAESHGAAGQTTPQGGSPAGAPVDTKGVAFDANYCGQAKDPYYATGKRSGQWKKRKGVDDADYDVWYASQLGDSAPAPEVNTSAAFGAPTEAAAEPETSVPTTTGEFMGWVSELQAAGRLTQEHVNQAYAANGLGINALFPPNTEEQIAANIAKLYEALSHVAA